MAEPIWLIEARKNIGLKEIVGLKHNPTILSWLKKLKAWWFEDETPWCGTFVAHCLEASGLPVSKNWMRAKDWATYGSNLGVRVLAPGAILVFERQGGGHVGFYVGEDDMCYHVLGGNQGNAVSITRILRSRCIAQRWPKDQPVNGKPVRLTLSGTISKNEA